MYNNVDKFRRDRRIRWWVLAGVLALVAVSFFVGITLWLGFSVTQTETTPSYKTKSTSNRKQQEMSFVDGHVTKTREQTTTTSSTMDIEEDATVEGGSLHPTVPTLQDVMMEEEAHVQEIPNESKQAEELPVPVQRINNHDSFGSPLYPQPIPETPTQHSHQISVVTEEDSDVITTTTSTASSSSSEAADDQEAISDENKHQFNVYSSRVKHRRQQEDETLLKNPSRVEIIRRQGGNLVLENINHPLPSDQKKIENFSALPSTDETSKHRLLETSSSIVDTHENVMAENIHMQHRILEEKGNTANLQESSDNNPKKTDPTFSFERNYPEESLMAAFKNAANRDVRLSFLENHQRRHLPAPESPVRRFDENIEEEHSDSTSDRLQRNGAEQILQGHTYSPIDPQKYDGENPESAENPVSSFLQGRVHDLYTWISTDKEITNHSVSGDFKSLLLALNKSITEGNSSIILSKLKNMYYNGENDAVFNVTDPSVISNSSSLISFGLLAFDLLLLHNVQQIAWGDELQVGRDMLKDPEIAALNALFLDPSKVRGMNDPVDATLEDEFVDKSVLEEFMDFINSALRAVMNLGRAYKSDTYTLDCIWTLYCRNLDKTARMNGPYGFLAKLNGLGLRLLMGEFPLETALDTILREATQGWSSMNCSKMFPRCSAKNATDVVLKTALGVSGET